jgi:Cd2+/Zn2+-exporting ATPase
MGIQSKSAARLIWARACPPPLQDERTRLEAQGKTVMLVKRDGAHIGMIALADQLRAEAAAVVQALKAQGIAVAMLTGDNAQAASAIAEQAGVDRVYAELMPEDKVAIVQRLASEVGAAAMIGDGVNDAPALAAAQIGIAMGAAGTDVALETADVVLMGDKLALIPYAIGLSRQARPSRLAEHRVFAAGDRGADRGRVSGGAAAAARRAGA